MNNSDDQQAALKALTKPGCPYCGSVISGQQAIHPGHCGNETCRTVHIVKGARTRENQRDQDYGERQQDARTKSAGPVGEAAKTLGVQGEDILIAVVPFQNDPIEPLPEQRRAAFEAHLRRVVDEAFDAEPGTISLLNYQNNPAAEPTIVAAACSACQGSCCKRGGPRHAFLTRQTVYAMLQNDPELDRDVVVEHYLDALPEVSTRDGCVYQGPQGCTLQRDWRAALCNTFHCHDLYKLHDLTDGRSDVPVALVGINDDEPGKVVAFQADIGAITIDPTPTATD